MELLLFVRDVNKSLAYLPFLACSCTSHLISLLFWLVGQSLFTHTGKQCFHEQQQRNFLKRRKRTIKAAVSSSTSSFCHSHVPYSRDRKEKQNRMGDKRSILHPREVFDIWHLESDRNCRRGYRLCKSNLYPPKAAKIWDRTRWVSRGSGNQCPSKLFSQDVLVTNPKILLLPPPSLSLQLALSFFHFVN